MISAVIGVLLIVGGAYCFARLVISVLGTHRRKPVSNPFLAEGAGLGLVSTSFVGICLVADAAYNSLPSIAAHGVLVLAAATCCASYPIIWRKLKVEERTAGAKTRLGLVGDAPIVPAKAGRKQAA